METQLNLAPGWLLRNHPKVFLYVAQKRVVGGAVVERITCAAIARHVLGHGEVCSKASTSTVGGGRHTGGGGGGVVVMTHKAVLGVRGVWVAADMRRRGIATRLLDVARCVRNDF